MGAISGHRAPSKGAKADGTAGKQATHDGRTSAKGAKAHGTAGKPAVYTHGSTPADTESAFRHGRKRTGTVPTG